MRAAIAVTLIAVLAVTIAASPLTPEPPFTGEHTYVASWTGEPPVVWEISDGTIFDWLTGEVVGTYYRDGNSIQAVLDLDGSGFDTYEIIWDSANGVWIVNLVIESSYLGRWLFPVGYVRP